jgi:CubicO group peptidase (beta-lactamase class C family)
MMYFIKLALQLLIATLGLFLFACGGDADKQNLLDDDIAISKYSYAAPLAGTDEWDVGHVRDLNVNQMLLTQMMDAIYSQSFRNISSVLIVRNNTLIMDELLRTNLDTYDLSVGNSDLRVHTLQSVSKSFVSALVGIAIDQGVIQDVQSPFYQFFSEYPSFENWDDRKGAMSLQDVLTMRHGLEYDEWSGDSLNFIYNNYQDNVKGLLDLPMATNPGTTFAYSTMASVALGAAVENASGIQLEEFARLNLFEPLGIESQIWWQTSGQRAHTGGGLFLNGRDMLKFGQLFLNGGSWNGEQIISSSWITESTSRSVDLNLSFSDGYGYQWWHESFNIEGRDPIDSYFAAGNGGQFIFIVPSKNAVVVLTGDNINDADLTYQPMVLMRDYILPALE